MYIPPIQPSQPSQPSQPTPAEIKQDMFNLLDMFRQIAEAMQPATLASQFHGVVAKMLKDLPYLPKDNRVEFKEFAQKFGLSDLKHDRDLDKTLSFLDGLEKSPDKLPEIMETLTRAIANLPF